MRDRQSSIKEIGVAILGYGIVGRGVAHAIRANADLITKKTGLRIRLLHILDIIDIHDGPDADLLTRSIDAILDDPGVQVVVETIGGLGAAFEFTKQAMEHNMHVVTSNKELVAEHGPELLALADANKVYYRFDASVGGGIPIILPVEECLVADDIDEVTGIINGTTNFMLTYMKSSGVGFEEALDKARELGYAEHNPVSDIEGLDACRKLAILSSIAFGKFLDWKTIHTEGISDVSLEDINRAGDLGRVLKLVARIRRTPGGMPEAYVLPVMLDRRCQLANVDGVYNAVLVHGDLTGNIMFYGKGAGMYPTGNAIVSDIIKAAGTGNSNLAPLDKEGMAPGGFMRQGGLVSGGDGFYGAAGLGANPYWDVGDALKLADFDMYTHDFYVRVKTPDPDAYRDILFREFPQAKLTPDFGGGEFVGGGEFIDGGGELVDGGYGEFVGGYGSDSEFVGGKKGSCIFTVAGLTEGDFSQKLARVNEKVAGSSTGFVARLLPRSL